VVVEDEAAHARLEVAAAGLRRQHEALAPALADAFTRVLRAGSFYPAAEVEAFESEFAAWLGVGHVVGVASGSAAISLVLRALGIGAGHEVVCVSNVDIAVGSPLEQTGARLVLVDIDPATHQLDPADLERCLTPRTRAVLVVHAYGFPADVDRVLEITAGRDLTVIEDLSVSLGATLGGRRVGTLASIAVGSLAPSKPLGALGQAGFVATASSAVAGEVRILANYGFEPDSLRAIQEMRPGARFRYRRAGYNGMMDELLAAGLRVKLPRLEGWIQARRRRYQSYLRGLAGIDPSRLALPAIVPRGIPSPRLLPIRVCGDRDGFVHHLARQGVPATLQYVPPLHRQQLFRTRRQTPLPGTDQAAEQVACLPLYPELTEDELAHVVRCVRRWVSSRAG
jgi:dTDP-3-amino-3,4,6-trideoxy-alpha-D-glucose transaminase